MLDHRKTPSLSIRNALNGATTSSVNDLLQTMSVSSLRDLALARTAISNMGQVGITVPFREKWQVGGDFRLTNTTGMPTSGTPIPVNGTTTSDGFVATTPGRGLEKSVTGQIIGSGLYKQGDIWSGSLTFSTSGTVNGRTVFLLQPYPDQQRLDDGYDTADVQLQRPVRRHNDANHADAARLISFQGAVHFRCGLRLPENQYERPQIGTNNTSLFYSAGLRWDF